MKVRMRSEMESESEDENRDGKVRTGSAKKEISVAYHCQQKG